MYICSRNKISKHYGKNKEKTVCMALLTCITMFAHGQEEVTKDQSGNLEQPKHLSPTTTIELDNKDENSTVIVNLKDSATSMEFNLYKNGTMIYSDYTTGEAGTSIRYRISGADRTSEYFVSVRTKETETEKLLFNKEE